MGVQVSRSHGMAEHVRRLTFLVAALGMLPMSITNADTSSEEIL